MKIDGFSANLGLILHIAVSLFNSLCLDVWVTRESRLVGCDYLRVPEADGASMKLKTLVLWFSKRRLPFSLRTSPAFLSCESAQLILQWVRPERQ